MLTWNGPSPVRICDACDQREADIRIRHKDHPSKDICLCAVCYSALNRLNRLSQEKPKIVVDSEPKKKGQ